MTDRTAPGFDITTLPPFRPRLPWIGGDLQTVRNTLRYVAPDFGPYPARRLALPLDDGTGDALQALLNEPTRAADLPLVMLIHGLTGCEASKNIETSAAFFLSRGFRVLRLNQRGAGPSAATSTQHYHGGRSADLAATLRALPDDLRRNGLVLMGISLGGNVLLKCLAEGDSLSDVRAAVAVSPPIDLKTAQRRIMEPRNAVYHWHLLRHMKAGLVSPAMRDRLVDPAFAQRIVTVYDFDDLIVAPANGFDGAEDYYSRSSAKPLLGHITVPTFIIHPRNDPWVPAAMLDDAAVGVGRPVQAVTPDDGGHIGFHDAHDRWPWHNRCAAAFFSYYASL
ncbi:MAG: alpha/beta fold hydrolase [Rhodospirillaceae bacterium]|nr:alpha/beta fold hydrolase [Rhodospirillaceae bacterium]